MLSQMELRNFKCFSEVELKTGQINLLCGLNGMGKSSLIQSMLLLRQSFEAGDLDKGSLLRSGSYTDLGGIRDILFEEATSDIIEMSLFDSEIDQPCRFVFDFTQSIQFEEQFGLRIENLNPPKISTGWLATPPLGGNLIYVSADRVGPRKSYNFSDSRYRNNDLGARGEYAVNYLAANKDRVLPEDDVRCPRNSPSRRYGEIIDHWLGLITPGTHLEMSSILNADAIVASFAFDRADDVQSQPLRATNVGFGLSYVLPVLATFLAPPGTLGIVENPEAHLHPSGQVKIAELAIQAAKAGIQLFIETHSDHFMNGIRVGVKEGKIKPEQVLFHYFERKNGQTKIISPTLDQEGRLSAWPAGFFDQHEETLARLIAPRN